MYNIIKISDGVLTAFILATSNRRFAYLLTYLLETCYLDHPTDNKLSPMGARQSIDDLLNCGILSEFGMEANHFKFGTEIENTIPWMINYPKGAVVMVFNFSKYCEIGHFYILRQSVS